MAGLKPNCGDVVSVSPSLPRMLVFLCPGLAEIRETQEGGGQAHGRGEQAGGGHSRLYSCQAWCRREITSLKRLKFLAVYS